MSKFRSAYEAERLYLRTKQVSRIADNPEFFASRLRHWHGEVDLEKWADAVGFQSSEWDAPFCIHEIAGARCNSATLEEFERKYKLRRGALTDLLADKPEAEVTAEEPESEQEPTDSTAKAEVPAAKPYEGDRLGVL